MSETDFNVINDNNKPDNEIWKDIPGYEGHFQVSNKGRVKSLARMRKSRGGCLCPVKEKIMEFWVDSKKYHSVYLKKNGIGHSCAVHRLVLTAFISPKPEEMCCRHLDGNPSNNHLENLCWGTYEENAADRKRHGRNLTGERNHKAKLTMEKAQEIRRLYATGSYNQSQLAVAYKVHQTQISCIVNNITWKE